MRYRFWKKRLSSLGEQTTIDVGVYFQNPDHIQIGDNCWIDRNVIILAGPDYSKRERIVKTNEAYPGKHAFVHIGNNVHIAPNCIVSGISAGVYISDNCGIAATSKIYSFTHHYRSVKEPGNSNYAFALNISHERQCMVEGKIYLEENVGVAVNSVLLPGVTIRKNSFVLINSVVVGGEFKENSLIGGCPAISVGNRYFINEQH
jgi:acetyltransferase-like isoleucine patch superfamily enzyme